MRSLQFQRALIDSRLKLRPRLHLFGNVHGQGHDAFDLTFNIPYRLVNKIKIRFLRSSTTRNSIQEHPAVLADIRHSARVNLIE